MSAIAEATGDKPDAVKVLITLHEGMDAMDVVGPLEVFSWAQHDKKDPGEWCWHENRALPSHCLPSCD